jgi:hypothetical protein
MEDETLERVIDLFTQNVTQTTIIHIGRSTLMHLPLFTRVLHLTKLQNETARHEAYVTEQALRSAS